MASFTISPGNPYVGDTITVNASASTDPDGQIVKYQWDWTSDGAYDATGVMATHAYAGEGSYSITLRVTDNSGSVGTKSQALGVAARPAQVQILSHGFYIDSIGIAHVVGEVQWTGSYNIDLVELTATFKDADGKVVATGFTFSSISILTPGQRSPFEIIEPNNVPQIKSYSVQVTNFFPTTRVP